MKQGKEERKLPLLDVVRFTTVPVGNFRLEEDYFILQCPWGGNYLILSTHGSAWIFTNTSIQMRYDLGLMKSVL
jgi:hypothetical protein